MSKQKSWNEVKTHGDALEYVQENGAVWVRTESSHAIFRGPNGRTFPIQFNHPSWPIVSKMKSRVKREMVAAGIPLR